jgi:hypothetical protein
VSVVVECATGGGGRGDGADGARLGGGSCRLLRRAEKSKIFTDLFLENVECENVDAEEKVCHSHFEVIDITSSSSRHFIRLFFDAHDFSVLKHE